ncbi:enhancer of split m7 protein-like [Teleopsis dalmanni]|uniref:Enhancer of split region protein HLHm7 n=1 Tax=Teleopsis dalmanni TaxID=139649 RepID=G9I1M2_TELDL|nr:enhancer of split m7 protein-like [Teleopsis dalmanni]XP_037929448.1 enhancer of split m7 protein-like [Teleopsis dalmanni]XP_037956269.1 enhancer of split m7 protein [Teleopsis dalmanni]XP_037958330.1 enhancer of split m7 protein-like [Teleopsis dalmanni]AEV91209.1 enhancer of split region protein HLHm7 [Teleopsis dalmanni]
MATKYEESKTYQYRKVMKPLLERKRRARINKCLDDLKDLIGECMQQQCGDPSVKLEKADILELTVQHLRKLKTQKQNSTQDNTKSQHSFRSGYIQAANEVSRCLASLPKVDVAFGTQLMTHLGLRLNQLESAEEAHTAINTPLSINCGGASAHIASTAMYSPVSSGYASDSENSRCSPALSSKSFSSICNQGLLQINKQVWRPW